MKIENLQFILTPPISEGNNEYKIKVKVIDPADEFIYD